ncbi:MAG: twin-arginine translocase TatA/TatE family subunit [Bacteroidetes bacterium]|nr:MAG: twin-arginine translocase TatA/TatE family subunit [Bacteroidota bacterium]
MELFIMLGIPGIWQIGIIAVIILLLFGGKKVPELMKGLGSGIKEFKKGISEDDKEDSKESSKESSKEDKK